MDVAISSYTNDYILVHEKDIVHGDLTGVGLIFIYSIRSSINCWQSHILVDGSGNIRIADFGRSMLLADADNEMFGPVQTWNARWMAPELFAPLSEDDEEFQPLPPTKPGDIYSFGCVMLQVRCAMLGFLDHVTFLSWSKILSGKEPYWGGNAVEIIKQKLELEPFDGVEINMNETQRDLSSRCLSREPEMRPSIIEITDIVGPAVIR
jgi:serine/threonine protein kinase